MVIFTWVSLEDRGCTCARRSNECRVQEAGHGKDCVRELHTDMVLGCVHERLRRGDNAHTIVAPQDIHQVAVPECRPHLCMHEFVLFNLFQHLISDLCTFNEGASRCGSAEMHATSVHAHFCQDASLDTHFLLCI